MDRDDDYADKEAQLVEEAYVYLITKYPTESAEGELNPLGGEGSDGDQQGVAEPPKKQRKVSGDQSWGARGLGLDEDDHNIILNHTWLTDKHMNACSTLLKRANPSQSGLHHTITLAQTPHRCASPADYVQLAHINQAHWVCLSNINCPPGVVDVFDSAPHCSSTSKVL